MKSDCVKPCRIGGTFTTSSGHGEVDASTFIVDSTNKVICTVPGFYDKPNLELAEKVLEALNK